MFFSSFRNEELERSTVRKLFSVLETKIEIVGNISLAKLPLFSLPSLAFSCERNDEGLKVNEVSTLSLTDWMSKQS